MNKRILLINTEKSNLPELSAYKEELLRKGYEVKVVSKRKLIDINLKKYDIIWNFMGIDRKHYFLNNFIIHDYRSASSNKTKDKIKKIINIKPNLRIFLNEEVKNYYNFKDSVPFIFLDMGISENFLNTIKEKKNEYKFIYVGDVSKEREIDKFLKWFVKSEFKKEKLLLIGKYDIGLYNKYKKFLNIKFKGKIEYREVSSYLKKSEYALNLIPDKFPLNIQTSTKLLEYIALDLKIISSNTFYSRLLLEKEKKLDFILFDKYEEITLKKIENYKFKNIDMKSYLWEYKMRDFFKAIN